MDQWTALGVTAFTVLAVLWLSKQKAPWIKGLLNWFPAILFAYVIPALFTHSTGLDLSHVYLHTVSRNWIIPFAILTVMSALSIPQLRLVGPRPIILFVSGSMIIATLPVMLVFFATIVLPNGYGLFMAQGYWKGLVPIVGGWIGGSTSQLVLKELVGTPEPLFLSVLVLDNILVNIWTILMFQLIKRSDQLNRYFGITETIPDFVADEVRPGSRTLRSIIITIFGIVVVTLATNLLVDDFLWRVIVLSVTGLMLGNFVPRWNHPFVLKTGGILIILIMAILGLRLNFSGLSLPIPFVVIALVWIVAHYLFMMAVARIMGLHMAWVPIASMANLGGISTAPAVTSAYNEEWMPHAILLAILSMVSGTAWGMFTIYLFGLF
ncbi:MAG: DUF819 family protein [Cyclobacteriaceae bacterium]|nr:DUF819 family protein [Cyclobacteriaceae bacterium]MCB0499900.1 DUF819 family protein [Cyclobacteriaceae bacterium]MCB9239192.1 DUF819 family protein [Flammeovirgaceae bacterium]MCO5272658.1 DUF819 family protein [Cyclobacteriaceae bacterium]MCW5902787.1 DUF819 family protein [Cyclobacteriaceae bacterium]